MARRQRFIQMAVLLLGLVAAACSSDLPTVVSNDATGAIATTTTATVVDAVADDSAPVEAAPTLGELVQNEFVLGGVWGLDQNDLLADEARFSFYGSQIEPRLRIESRCGTGHLEFEPRFEDEYVISSAAWDGCEDDPLRRLLETAGRFTASTTDQHFDSLPVQIGATELRFSLLDGRSSFTVPDDGYPYWHLDDEDDEQEEEVLGTKVPELTPHVIAGEPLLKDMTWLRDSAELPPGRLEYIAVIGGSQYVMVNEAGEPQVVKERDHDKLQITVTAYHGAQKPVVYVAFMNHYSHVDPTYGTQSGDCDGGMFLGGLIAHSNEEYEFADQIDAVFENQIFFGDYECGGVDLSPWPEAFDGRFSIDTSIEGMLIMTNQDGATARFSLLDTGTNE